MYDYNKLNMGTGVPSMTSSVIYSLGVVIPETDILNKFNASVKPLFDTIKHNTDENDNLKGIRNWLLPMLMSGQATLAD